MEATAIKTIWGVDPTHSEVQFKIKHLVISTVTGDFSDFSASIESNNEDFDGASAKFEAKIASISTKNADRDAHLKSADFFDAEKFPTLSFESSRFVKVGSNEYEVLGNLTLKGITKEIRLKAEFGGIMDDFYGNRKAGFEIEGKINRQDFGLTWGAITEAGGVVVSDEVRLLLNIQFVKQA
jgi:polyisoprenoid-binding protein YceI